MTTLPRPTRILCAQEGCTERILARPEGPFPAYCVEHACECLPQIGAHPSLPIAYARALMAHAQSVCPVHGGRG